MEAAEHAFRRAAEELGLSVQGTGLLRDVYLPTTRWLAKQCRHAKRPLLVGVNGAQGSGKSTFCYFLSRILADTAGLNVVTLSIDDVYLTRSDRDSLGERIHTLCRIRGVPGTHDLELTNRTFDQLLKAQAGDTIPIPRFDKACDDRCPESAWDTAEGPIDLVLFEGWCVGCPDLPAWTGPYNAREAREDPTGVWARWSDAYLASGYRALFERLDYQIMIQVPSMHTVREGRWLQERKLRKKHLDAGADLTTLNGLMTRTEVLDYVALFERHTEHMLEVLPALSDVLIRRDDALEFSLVHVPDNEPDV